MKFEEMSDELKASMTEEQIRKQIEIEMMESGINQVEYQDTFDQPMPTLKETNYYTVGGIYFETQKQAEKFIELHPMKSAYDWRIGSEIRFTEDIEKEIRIEKQYNKHEVVNIRGTDLVEWNKQRVEHDRQKRKYDNFISDRNAIHNKIWSAHVKAKEVINEKTKIKETYEEYKTLTNGDNELAYTFLLKHYGEEKVKNANVVAAATTLTQDE
jgi:hypothetical protein